MEAELLNLAHVPRELSKHGAKGIGYRHVYQSVIDGEIPAQNINGRWFVSRVDVPAIAEKLRKNGT